MRKTLLSLVGVAALLSFGTQTATAGYVVDTLLYTGFNTDVLEDGSTVDWATGDIVGAGKKDVESVQGAGWIVGGGPNGQRMNNQAGTCAPNDSTFTQNYAPYSAEDFGCTPNALSWLKSSNGGYLITPEPVAACEISMWMCMAKSETRKEYLEVSYSADKSEWTVLDTILVDTFKKFKRHNLTYSGDEAVYFKFTSVSTNGSNNNMLISSLLFHNTEFVVDDLKVAYIYDGSYSTYCGIDNDPIFQQSLQNYDAVAIDVAGKTVADIPLDSLQKTYNVVVLSEAISSGHAYAKAMVDLVNRVPMLNFKSFMYKSSVWNWGKGVNPSPKADAIVVHPDYYESPLFQNISVDLAEAEGLLQLFAGEVGDKNNMQAYEAAAGSLIADDPVIATVGGYAGIHQHGEKNAYLLLPISSDDMLRDGEINLTEDAFILVNNAIEYLAMTKTDIAPARAPEFSMEYVDGLTRVAISTQSEEASIYYTTDGTDPTEESTLYTDTLSFTAGVRLKAVAGGGAYSLSDIVSDTVVVKTILPIPTYVINSTEGSNAKEVVFTAPVEGAEVYVNFVGSADLNQSQAMTSVILTQSTMVTCFAYDNNHLPSEAVTFAVDVAGKAMNDTLVHLNFQDWNTAELIDGKYYDFYKSVEEGETVTQVPADSLVTRVDQEGWEIGSYGQRVLVQKTGTVSEIGKDYGPADIFSTGATGWALSFLVCKNGDDPTNAYLRSTAAYAGPFDVVVYLTGQQSASNYECVEILTSTDGENWALLDSIGSYNYKKMHRGVAHYTGTDPVYVKMKSASLVSDMTKTKTMVFDLLLLAEGTEVGIEGIASDAAKSVVSVKMFNVAGQRLQGATTGLNIVVTEFSDGSIRTQKVFVK